MSSLHDLRQSLATHADEVTDHDAVTRAAAVHHRVVAIRRRRRAVAAGALVTVVVAGMAGTLVSRASNDASPAAPVILGQKAPTTMRSLGYAYRTDGHGESFDRAGSVDVSSSSRPQLFSWTTDGARRVTVTLPDGDVVHSGTQGFGDFVVLDPGTQGTIRVAVPKGHVGLASYALTGAAPAGYTKAGITYRAHVADTPLLGAGIGDLGQAVVHASYVAPKGWVSLHTLCTDLSHDDVVNVTLNGGPAMSQGSCGAGATFDPGAFSDFASPSVHPGHRVQVRIWVSRSFKDHTPLPASAVPGLRIGVGVYGPTDQRALVGRNTVPVATERLGHTWRLRTVRTSRGPAIDLPAKPYDRSAELVASSPGRVDVSLGVTGQTPQGGSFVGGGGLPDLWVPAGSRVHATLTHGGGSFGVALYRRTS